MTSSVLFRPRPLGYLAIFLEAAILAKTTSALIIKPVLGDMTTGTLDAIFGDLADDFNYLLEGKKCKFNYSNRVVRDAVRANGYTGACVQLKGDWEFLDQALGLPRWDNASSGMCWLCKATNNGN